MNVRCGHSNPGGKFPDRPARHDVAVCDRTQPAPKRCPAGCKRTDKRGQRQSVDPAPAGTSQTASIARPAARRTANRRRPVVQESSGQRAAYSVACRCPQSESATGPCALGRRASWRAPRPKSPHAANQSGRVQTFLCKWPPRFPLRVVRCPPRGPLRLRPG